MTATHLILPAWWVKAFESAIVADAEGDSAMDQARRAGLAPAFGDLELSALAMVMSDLQRQILGSTGRRLTVDPEAHVKNAPTSVRARRLLFEKVVQQLAGIRILGECRDGEMTGVPLFGRDAWVTAAEGRQRARPGLSLALEPGPYGSELILGFTDAHLDLLRVVRGEQPAAGLLGGQGPLAVPRSLWLELQGLEQLALLRLERAMRWEGRWLQLEGVCGLPLRELLGGLRLVESRQAADSGAGLGGQLRMLARFGRKLTAHGFTTAAMMEPAQQFLAVDPRDDGELMLVWQLARERILQDPIPAYRDAASRWLVTGRVAGESLTLARLVAPPWNEEAAISDWNRLMAVPLGMGRAAAAAGDPGADPLPAIELSPVTLLNPVALFFEHTQRALAAGSGGVLPLPAEIQAFPEWRAACDPQLATGAVEERAARFARWLPDEPEALRILRDVPLATLASAATAADASALGALRSRLVAARAGAVAAEPRQKTLAAAETTEPRRQGATADPGADGETQGEAARRKAAVSGALAARMMKAAADELQAMRAGDPERYKELRRGYLASLDEAGRRLVLDVQKRMQPAIFEEHLRQRLVRFMVDHPAAWRSAESPRRLPL